MIIDHACGLHEGVGDGGADEVETSFFEGFAQGIGLWVFCWVIGHRFGALFLFVRSEAPQPLDGIF